MAEIKQIIVNEKNYKVQKLDVLETIYLHAEFLHELGSLAGSLLDIVFRMSKGENVEITEIGNTLSKADPEAIKKLTPKILQQVITPKNEFLSDAVAIQAWFSQPENKSDIWPVIIAAGNVLLGEHLPDFLKGMLRIKEVKEVPAQ